LRKVEDKVPGLFAVIGSLWARTEIVITPTAQTRNEQQTHISLKLTQENWRKEASDIAP
jgi:hypothetical protein